MSNYIGSGGHGHPQLTKNAVELMLRNTDHEINKQSICTFQPYVQVISVKPIKEVNSSGSDRFRLILSDGERYVQSMTGLNALQLSNGNGPNVINHISELQQNSIIKMNNYIPKAVNKRLVIIVVSFTVITGPIPERIGVPQDIEKSTGIVDDLLQFAASSTGFTSIHPSRSTTGADPTTIGTGSATTNTSVYHKQPDRPVSSTANPYLRTNAVPVTPLSNSNAPIVRSLAMSSSSHITPITALNMYNNRWTIQARVTTKSDIRTWSNAKGEGSLFSVELLDPSGTDIRATFFKDAVDKFYSTLQIGSVYTFSGGRLKVANMQYNTCKSSYEITFDANAEIHLQTDTNEIQKQQYEFIPKIASIEQMDPTTTKTLDVLAIVKAVSPVHSLISKKSGQELVKCDIELCDDSGTDISMTLWSTMAENAASLYSNHPVVAIRRARLTEYNGGKTLGMSQGSGGIDINPDVPQAKQLRLWYDRTGGTTASTNGPSKSLSSNGTTGGANRMDSLIDRKDISSIKENNMGYNDKPDYITLRGVCTFIKRDKEGGAWYPACPNPVDPCRNLYKVTQGTDGQWLCEKCSSYYPKPIRRWIFSAVIEDPSGSTWVSFFNEQGEKLLGLTAEEGYRLAYENSNNYDATFDQDAYDSIFYKGLHREFLLKCKVKNEISPTDGEARIKTSVVALQEIDYVQESVDILAALEQPM